MFVGVRSCRDDIVLLSVFFPGFDGGCTCWHIMVWDIDSHLLMMDLIEHGEL